MNKDYMQMAIDQAQRAARAGEIPVGAVLVDGVSGEVIAESGNECEQTNDPTAHAEIVTIRKAAEHFGNLRLEACDLYVTLEPCTMCAGAISLARLRRLYFGAYDPKGGGVEHGARFFDQPTCHHKPDVIGGLREKECADLLLDFFKQRR